MSFAARPHVCHRPGNPNHAEAKTKHPWRIEDGTVTGGLIKRLSPAMVHSYFEYVTSEYPRGQAVHGMLLVQLHGASGGQPWAPVAARRMLGRAGKRAELGAVKPHVLAAQRPHGRARPDRARGAALAGDLGALRCSRSTSSPSSCAARCGRTGHSPAPSVR
jgi:hypothetical protein